MPTKTLLIVEDDDVQRHGLESFLRNEGYTVIATSDSTEALEQMRQGAEPDLILLDMMVPAPAQDGWYFIEKRRRLPDVAKVPVVIVTGLGVASLEWVQSLGASGLVRKPIAVDRLLTEIQRCSTHGD